MQFIGSNADPFVESREPLIARVNYFVGKDPRRWHTNIPTAREVIVHGEWTGIDVVYGRDHKDSEGIECTFIVAPGADLSKIRLRFEGAGRARISPEGDIVIQFGGYQVRFTSPAVFEKNGEKRLPVPAHFVTTKSSAGTDREQFQIQLAAGNDRNSGLIIDPTLTYSTYLGGNGQANAVVGYGTGDSINAIALDSEGNEYLTGSTSSPDFPATNSGFLSPCPFTGSTCNTAFVVKLDSKTGQVIYSTLLGGGPGDAGNGIVVDQAGDAYVAGATDSNQFPTTSNAFVKQCNSCGGGVAFVTKLSPNGSSLVYSTLLAADSSNGSANAIAIDQGGNAYVTGQANNDAFAMVLNSAGSALNYDVALPFARGNAIAVSTDHRLFVGGQTMNQYFPTTRNAFQRRCPDCFENNAAFISVFDPSKGNNQDSLTYSTFFGGRRESDSVQGIAVDSAGRGWVVGVSGGGHLPSSSEKFGSHKKCLQADNCSAAFLAIFDPRKRGAASRAYSGLFGGDGSDSANSIALDNAGNAYVVGQTSSPNFPRTSNAVQSSYSPCDKCFQSRAAGFVAVLHPGKSRPVYASYLGGATSLPPYGEEALPIPQPDAAKGVAISADGVIHVVGTTFADNFPVTQNAQTKTCMACAAFGSNGFITRINPTASSSLSALEYSSYIGGGGPRIRGDAASAVAMDTIGNIYVAGVTTSTDFPISAKAVQATCPGCPVFTEDGYVREGSNAFVAKLNPTAEPDEQLIYATYLGGSASDQATGVAVDLMGEAYVVGEAISPDFPTTSNAFANQHEDDGGVFFSKLDSSGDSLLYSVAFASGIPAGVTVDPYGNALIGGMTNTKTFPTTPGALQSTCTPCGTPYTDTYGGFFSKINPAATGALSLVYSTYLSGSGNRYNNGYLTSGSDIVYSIASDSAGDAILTGSATSTDFPVTPNAFQAQCPISCQAAFISVIDPFATGSNQLPYSTFFTGTTGQGGPYVWGYAVQVDLFGNIYIGGHTTSYDLPVSPQSFSPSCPSGGLCGSGFLAELNPKVTPDSQLIYGTYLGGVGESSNPRFDDTVTALGVDGQGRIYAAGHTFSPTFPVTSDAFQSTCAACTPQNRATNSGNSGFLTVVDPAQAGINQLVYSTYLGGSKYDAATGLAIGPSGTVAIAGFAGSMDYPTTSNAFQLRCPACRNPGLSGGDAFVALFQF